MEKVQFLEKFLVQFEETDSLGITLETRFRELPEWSSMIALSVIAMIDEEFQVKITGEDIRMSTTIYDIYNKVNERIK